MTDLLMSGFVDTFRALYPDAAGRYTWWSYFRRARETNAGWRIDYFIVSERLREKLATRSFTATCTGPTTARWGWSWMCDVRIYCTAGRARTTDAVRPE